MKIRIGALLLCFMLAVSASAEGKISATGKATVYAPADCAGISLGVNYFGADVADLQKQANETISAICEALKAEGLEDRNIATDNFNVYAEYDYSQNGERMLKGYNVSNNLSINTTDIDSLGRYIDAAFAVGANSFGSVSFTLLDREAAEHKALSAAVENARTKAEVMAAALGEELGALEMLAEGTSGGYYEVNSVNSMKMEEAAMGTADMGMTIFAAQVPVTASVQISYEVK